MKLTCTVRGGILLDAYKDWIKSDSRVLDIGCGDGTMGKMLADKFGCSVEGTDIMSFVKNGIPFKLMPNETTLPYADNSFDMAMLNDMLHHTRVQKEMITEALRVAKNVLIFETKPTMMAKVLDHVLNWQHNVNMPIPLTHKTPDDWSAVFKEMGLDFEYREHKKSFLYPVSHFAFNIRRR